MIDLQDIITTKRELLSRETYSRNPINYSAGMAEDQKDRHIQYLIDVKRYNLKLKQVIQTAGRRRMIMMEPMIRFARIRLVMFHPKS